MKHESYTDTDCNRCARYNHQKTGTGTVGFGNKDKWRPSKLQHCWDRSAYWEVSWRLEETCCHSDSSGEPSAYTGVKNSPTIKTKIIARWNEDKKKDKNHSKILLDTEKSPGDVRRLVATQVPMKDHQLKLARSDIITVTEGLLKGLEV